jgi:hypothetical protein
MKRKNYIQRYQTLIVNLTALFNVIHLVSILSKSEMFDLGKEKRGEMT